MRILEVCVDLDGGGIDRYLLNYCSRIKDINFDFAIVDTGKVGILEQPLKEIGCNIYRVPRQSGGIRANYNSLKEIMLNNKYDAVHVHLGYRGALALLCAKNCGIKTRIVHAHIAYEPEGIKQKCIRKIFTALTKFLATHLAACGIEAAKWVWGKKAYERGNVIIHNNAIEATKFAFSEKARLDARKALGISNETFVVGHVGRLSAQKNQKRLLDIFKEIINGKPNTKLVLVGRGEDEQELRAKATELGIEQLVEFLGVREDVHNLLSAFDVFVFPSTHEGLPFTLVETQCNGLPAVCADTITDKIKLGDAIEFLSLDDSDQKWAQKAIDMAKDGHFMDGEKTVTAAGYDIEEEAKKLKKYYFDSVKAGIK